MPMPQPVWLASISSISRPSSNLSWLTQGPGFPYLLRPGAKTLIIGPGGGWDVSRALASGSKDITGVEINPIIANVIMRKKFPQYSNDLYFRPEVKIVVEDGRSFVRRSHEHYQVLQATLVDTWASTAAGAFALSENNLYTTNAFVDYLSHLTADGVMAFTRWGFDPPRESLRVVVSLAYAALKQLGQERTGTGTSSWCATTLQQLRALGRTGHDPDFAQSIQRRRYQQHSGRGADREDASHLCAGHDPHRAPFANCCLLPTKSTSTTHIRSMCGP